MINQLITHQMSLKFVSTGVSIGNDISNLTYNKQQTLNALSTVLK